MRLRRPAAALVLALTAVACGGGYEQALIAHFFTASRLEDRTALQPIATVMFDPRTDGTVLRFDITGINTAADGTERVTVSARVHLPGGDTVEKTLVVTMRRSDPAVDKGMTSRWIITGIS